MSVDPNDMNSFDDLTTLDEEAPPEESSNKTFIIVAAVLGVIVLLSIICVVGYAFTLQRQAAERDEALATQVEQDRQVNEGLTQKAVSDGLTLVAAYTPTIQPTSTPVFEQATPTLEQADPQTATVAAALTQAAQAQLTVTALPTSTLLPNTGFVDDVGVPGLVVMAIALVGVILLARRLRVAPAK